MFKFGKQRQDEEDLQRAVELLDIGMSRHMFLEWLIQHHAELFGLVDNHPIERYLAEAGIDAHISGGSRGAELRVGEAHAPAPRWFGGSSFWNELRPDRPMTGQELFEVLKNK